MKTSKSFMLGYALCAFLAFSFSSCAEDIPYNASDEAKNEFMKDWLTRFGLVSSKQDWNSATTVTAEVDPSSFSSNATVYIYNANPVAGGSLIGRASQHSVLKLDVLKGADKVFVQVRDREGHTFANSYYPIESGRVQIGKAVSRASASRSASCGEKVEFAESAIPSRRLKDTSYTLRDAIDVGDTEFAWFTGNVKTVPFNFGWKIEDAECLEFIDIKEKLIYCPTDASYFMRNMGYPYYGGFSESDFKAYPEFSDNSWCRLFPASHPVTYQYIDGVESGEDCTILLSELLPVFGKGAYFEESRNPSCLERWKNYFVPNVTYRVSGEVSLDYMYGATANGNVFGYYYWQDGENPMDAVRYILIDDARPQSNLKLNHVYLSSGMQLSTYMLNPETVPVDATITGTKYKVPYFNQSGIEDPAGFPEGTHLAFFLIANGYGQTSSWLSQTNYSVREHNFSMQRTFSGYKIDSSDANMNEGEIDAVSFSYKGVIYLGFEDRGGDKDMNDIVFFVNGDVEADEDPVAGPEFMPMILSLDIFEDPTYVPGGGDTPGSTPTPGETPGAGSGDSGTDIPTEEDPGVAPGSGADSWIVACEDLGSTGDYDFNDVVFSVSHVAGDDYMVITPLAAGGILRSVICFDGAPINGDEERSEIHYMLRGKADGTYPILNTGAAWAKGRSIRLSCPTDFSMADGFSRFSIRVYNGDVYSNAVVINAPAKGEAPQMMCLPGTWCWPRENTRITQAYPMFADWNSDDMALGWLANAVAARIFKR